MRMRVGVGMRVLMFCYFFLFMHFYPGTMTTHAESMCIRVRVYMRCVRKRAPARACVCLRAHACVRACARGRKLRAPALEHGSVRAHAHVHVRARKRVCARARALACACASFCTCVYGDACERVHMVIHTRMHV